jgi:hypothetical protein
MINYKLRVAKYFGIPIKRLLAPQIQYLDNTHRFLDTHSLFVYGYDGFEKNYFVEPIETHLDLWRIDPPFRSRFEKIV